MLEIGAMQSIARTASAGELTSLAESAVEQNSRDHICASTLARFCAIGLCVMTALDAYLDNVVPKARDVLGR